MVKISKSMQLMISIFRVSNNNFYLLAYPSFLNNTINFTNDCHYVLLYGVPFVSNFIIGRQLEEPGDYESSGHLCKSLSQWN